VNGDRDTRGATTAMLAAYCAGATALVLVAGRGSGLPVGALAGRHLLLAALALTLARFDRGGAVGAVRWFHRWLPMMALPWLYSAAGQMRHLVVATDRDARIAAWDAALFPGEWYRIGARLSPAALEAAHAAYASYYLLLFVPALLAERRRPRAVEGYLWAITATMLAHYALHFVLPVAGPMAREGISGRGVLFVPLVEAAYRSFDRGGFAFPSTHVAAAVVAAAFAARRLASARGLLFALWVAAIAVSTVVCGYHYPIDVPAGLLTGALGGYVGVRRAREREGWHPACVVGREGSTAGAAATSAAPDSGRRGT
jgi:membrane-associated phospholipid phosphatase